MLESDAIGHVPSDFYCVQRVARQRLAVVAGTEMGASEGTSSHVLRSLNVHFGGREVLEGPGVDDATDGWRAACSCGWRGTTVHPRTRWPSACGNAPTS